METNTWEVLLLTKGKDKERCNTKALELNTLGAGKTIRNKVTGSRLITMDNMLESSSTTKSTAKESLTTKGKKEIVSFLGFGLRT